MAEPSDLNIFDQRARAAGFSEKLIDAFLAGKNEAFGGGTPREALEEGRLMEVIEAANRLAEARPSETPGCNCASHGLAAEYRHGHGCPYGAHLRRRAWEAWRETDRVMGATSTNGPMSERQAPRERERMRNTTLGQTTMQNARGEWVPAIPMPYQFTFVIVPYAECGDCHARFFARHRGRALRRYEEHYALHHILKPEASR